MTTTHATENGVELGLIRLAFEHRQPDAMSRAQRLQARAVAESVKLLAHHELVNQALEQGVEFHEAQAEAGQGAVHLPTKAEQLLARAWELADVANAVGALIDTYGKRRLRDDEGPTTELLAQVARGKGDPILRLRALDKIADIDVRNAREIGAVLHHVTAGSSMKVQQLDRVRGGRTEADGWLTLLHAFVYLPWADRCRAALPLMLGLIVEGESLKALARRHGMGWGTALDRVQRAFAAYADMRKRYAKDGASANKRRVAAGSDLPLPHNRRAA